MNEIKWDLFQCDGGWCGNSGTCNREVCHHYRSWRLRAMALSHERWSKIGLKTLGDTSSWISFPPRSGRSQFSRILWRSQGQNKQSLWKQWGWVLWAEIIWDPVLSRCPWRPCCHSVHGKECESWKQMTAINSIMPLKGSLISLKWYSMNSRIRLFLGRLWRLAEAQLTNYSSKLAGLN